MSIKRGRNIAVVKGSVLNVLNCVQMDYDKSSA